MTIRIPDDVARGLQGIAAVQQKSVEQIAVENLRSLLDTTGSPKVVLRAVQQLPHPSAAAIDDLEAAVRAARLPVRDRDLFGNDRRGDRLVFSPARTRDRKHRASCPD